MRSADVAVVGAGPAGIAAAITLARAGRQVVVVDRATFPRDKCCGDGLTTGALRLLEELGLDPNAVASWQPVHDVVVRDPTGREVRLPLPRDRGAFAAVARRRDLDAALVELARSSGVTVVEGAALTGATAGEDRITLDVAGVGGVQARYAIGADGMWSPLRRLLGAGPEQRDLGAWHAFRQYFTDVGPRGASELFVWFEPDLLPGYAWSFPVAGGGANVGFGIQRGGELTVQEMGRRWPELLARPHVREVLGPHARPEGPHRAWPIPAHVGRAPAERSGGSGSVRRRCRRRLRPPDRRGHRPSAAHRAPGRRRGARRRRPRPGVGGTALPHGGGPPPVRRRPHEPAVDRRRPPQEGCVRRAAPGRRLAVDTTELRPLALRGLPAGVPGDAAPMVPPRHGGRRRLVPGRRAHGGRADRGQRERERRDRPRRFTSGTSTGNSTGVGFPQPSGAPAAMRTPPVPAPERRLRLLPPRRARRRSGGWPIRRGRTL